MQKQWKVILVISLTLNIVLVLLISEKPMGRAIEKKVTKHLVINHQNKANKMRGNISKYSSFYQEKVSQFSTFHVTKKSVVFVGDSITDMGDWNQFFPYQDVINMGINGDSIQGVRDRVNLITRGQPAKIFIMIGTNNLSGNQSVEALANNYEKMVDSIKSQSPHSKLFIQSVLPVNEKVWKTEANASLKRRHESNAKIKQFNALIKKIALKNHVTYINLYPLFTDKNGDLNMKYSVSGLHLGGTGYKVWVNAISKYVEQ